MSSTTQLVDLPEDIFVLIFPYLEVPEFLSLCSVNKHFHEVFLKNPEYWRDRTSKTFRVPVHPLLRADGPRWYWLYKNLRTNTKVYCWGGTARLRGNHTNITWPTEVPIPSKVGSIVDLQCGGWSTSFLTSDGIIYLSGRIEGLARERSNGPEYRPLNFYSDHKATTREFYNPSTAIKQFSSGRHHILGLSDDGIIWSWRDKNERGRPVEFLNVRTISNSQGSSEPGTITKVVAGWEINAAFVVGTGIVYWKRIQWNDEVDPKLHLTPCNVIAGTGLRRSTSNREHKDNKSTNLGEVRNFAVLEGYIIFITDLDKVYVVRDGEEKALELSKFSAPGRVLQDIQGAFRKFAAFSSDGEVLMGDVALIHEAFDISSLEQEDSESLSPLQPTMLPGLQHNGVISISFGDYHFCALHSNGKISTHGREPRGCGALGLGSLVGGIPFRSLTLGGDGRLQHLRDVQYFPFAEDLLHYIWFEPEKKHWLFYLNDKSRSMGKNPDWLGPLQDNRQDILEKYSPCVERAGDSWGDFPDIKAEDPDGLGAYFTLNVASAGWQSAALVLVNEKLANKIENKHRINYDNPEQEKPESSQADKKKGEQLPKYLWETRKFPPLPRSADGTIDFSIYNFDTWTYGLPPPDDGDTLTGSSS